ncbi:chondroitin sulfate glucuronyltransferase [Galendromus occidentalis]|uniref:Hexosyltransferase n=1 Tax=Galendromus occidentalis TaxID=34638 RepID=A0AAJ6QSE0_9ACAR|nr:chondroitin sulfate glucuronyltransferase [Galendromus occidentalis]
MLRRISLRRVPFMVGLFLGVIASLLLVSPLSCDVDADVAIRPIINLQTRDTEANKQYSTVIRPRFYSTELEIKEKLLVISLSDRENFDDFGRAFNHTLASHASKLVFYVCSDSASNSSASRANVVFVHSECNRLLYHAMLHIETRQLAKEYDFVLIARASTFLRGDNLMSLVNHMSISQDIYMGTPLATDPRICDLEYGILFSESVLFRILPNLQKCRGDADFLDDDDALTCLLKYNPISCQTRVGNSQYLSVDADSRLDPRSFSDSQRPVISVAPLNYHNNFYQLNHKLDQQTYKKVQRQLVGISSNIAEINDRCSLPDLWPRGLRKFFQPKKRFDVIRTTYFNMTHLFWNTDNKVIEALNEISSSDIESIVRACEKHLQEKVTLVNGWLTVDPVIGATYLIDVSLNGNLKRLKVVRPLSLSELTPMPYVTESTRISIVVVVHGGEIDRALAFLQNYSKLMQKGDNSMLLLVFAYRDKENEEDGFDRVRKLAETYSKQFLKKAARIAVLKIQCPEHIPEFGLIDIVASKLSPEGIMLIVQPNVLLTENFLNRVRLNTIRNEQTFLPVPFTLYKNLAQTVGQSITKDSGFFDINNVENLSIFVGDYLRIRRNLPLIPLATVSADLDREAYKDCIYGIAEVLLATKELHVMRAAEPELRIEYMHRVCENVTSNSRQSAHCKRTNKITVGSKKYLASLVAS